MPFEAAALDLMSLSLSDHKVLICTLCKAGVHCKQTHDHAEAHHKYSIRLGAKVHFDYVIDRLMERDMLLPFRFGPRPQPLPGYGNACLERRELREPVPGYRCLYEGCNHARIDRDANHRHNNEHVFPHPVQSFFLDTSASWFPVIDPSPPSNTPSDTARGLSVLDEIVQQPRKVADVHQNSTFRDRNKLIEAANWHHILAPIVKDHHLIILVEKLLNLPDNDLKSKNADAYSAIRVAVKAQLTHAASMVQNPREWGLPFKILSILGRDMG
jgi:hypothetical protein